MLKSFCAFSVAALLSCSFLVPDPDPSPNQTPDVSPVHSDHHLPFEIVITKASWQLPEGWHSGVFATHHGKWLFFAGRTNGMHGFAPDDENFPVERQNTRVYVVDPKTQTVYRRSLKSKRSGLHRQQIDDLSVTSPQFYQKGETLYMTGGYGVDKNGEFSTKPLLTAVDIPGLIHWVVNPDERETAAQHIRQISDPIFQVTGGEMTQMDDHSTLLVFGQNFTGFYSNGGSGVYTEQVRRFRIHDDGKHLSVEIKDPKPLIPDPNFRRRDLNVVPCIERKEGRSEPYLTAFSGVFTPQTGIWTVPVTISPTGHPSMENPEHEHTFKQAMNNYVSATAGLFSKEKNAMYTLLFGGITYGFFEDGHFETDQEFPFTNQVTAIKRNGKGHFKQYLLDGAFPVILSKGVNPGNQLLFGAGAQFVPAENLPSYDNTVIKFDRLNELVFLGYILGGIQSTLPNTNSIFDSTASPYIFKVWLEKK